jgi:hypothetical protein
MAMLGNLATGSAGAIGSGGLARDYSREATSGPTVSMMQAHTNKLSMHADALNSLNIRLATILSRMVGPSPEKSSGTTLPVSQDGVLHNAAFEAQRIGNGLDDLTGQLAKLDELI